MKKKQWTRRRFLESGAGVGAGALLRDPLSTIFKSLVLGFVQDSYAQSGGVAPKNLLFLHPNGGIASWYLYMWLHAYPDTCNPYRAHFHGTRFTELGAGSYQADQTDFATVDIPLPSGDPGGPLIRLPYAWGLQCPTAGGGSTPMSGMLNNIMTMVGCRMPSDGHIYQKIERPDGAMFSLTGSVFDTLTERGINKLLPAVTIGQFSPRYFKSAKNNASANVSTSNEADMMKMAFGAFIDESSDRILSGIFGQREAMDDLVGEMMGALGSYTRKAKGSAVADSIFQRRHEADQIFRQNVGAILEQYSERFAVYQDLVKRSFETRVAGIDDKPVYWDPEPLKRLNYAGFPGVAHTHQDLADVLHTGTPVYGFLGSTFALAEILFNGGYSSVVTNHYGSLGGTMFQGYRQGPTGGTRTWTFDNHGGTTPLDLIVTTKYSIGLIACLNEFRQRTDWNNTVMFHTSEMGRVPNLVYQRRNAGGGVWVDAFQVTNNAHGWQGNQGMIAGGCVNGPFGVGFIRQGVDAETQIQQFLTTYQNTPIQDRPNFSTTPGTWGEAGMVPAEYVSAIGVNRLNYSHMVSQVASMVGIPSPTPNFFAPVVPDGSGMYSLSGSLIGKLRIVPT